MIYKGIVPLAEQLHGGSSTVIRRVMHEEPNLQWEDVDEMERAIKEGKLPVLLEGAFDKR